LVGAVGGAAAGAMIGGAIYLTPASLGLILRRGLQELFKKAGGQHSKTAGALIGGFALGFAGGLIEPDYEVTLGTAFSTALTILDDALIRGAI